MLHKRKYAGAESFEVAILGGLIFCASIVTVTFLAPNISKIFLADKSPVKVTTSSYGVQDTDFDDTLSSKKLIASAHQDLTIKANKNTFPERPKYPTNVVVKNIYNEPAKIHPANVKYYSASTVSNYTPPSVTSNYVPSYNPPVNNYSPPVNNYSPVYVPPATTSTVTRNVTSTNSTSSTRQGGSAGTNVGLGTFTTTAANQPTASNKVTSSSGVYGKSSSSSSSRTTTAPQMGYRAPTTAPQMASNSGGSSSQKFIAPNPVSSRTTSSSSSSSSSSAASRFIALLMSLTKS